MSDVHYKLTQEVVETLAPPQSGRKVYFDLLLPGFGVRVSAPRRTGHVSKVYVAVYLVSGKLVCQRRREDASADRSNNASRRAASWSTAFQFD